MLKRERQAFIEKQINLHNRVLLTDLSNLMQVSEDTIRRDLNELACDGKIIKVHGGALSKSFHLSASSAAVYSLDAKKTIALKAASLITDGMFVLTSGGTTIIELAKALPASLKATFITPSLAAAYEYTHHQGIELIFTGGKISRSSQIATGADVVQRIQQFKPGICFMGVNAIDAEHGITDNDLEVVQVKQAMINAGGKLVCLAISEKLATTQPIKVCGLEQIHTLVTELNPACGQLQPYSNAGVEVL